MAFLQLADFNGSVEAVAFPKLWKELEEPLKADGIYGFKGKFETRQDKLSFILENIVKPEALEPEAVREAHISVVKDLCTKKNLHEMLDTCITFQGPCSLLLHIVDEQEVPGENGDTGTTTIVRNETVIRSAREFSVSCDDQLVATLKENPAVDAVWFD